MTPCLMSLLSLHFNLQQEERIAVRLLERMPGGWVSICARDFEHH